MFQMKLAIFVQEITSVILTPLVLLFSLPACAGKVIDFCREFTVHVNGIGYVCSFAVFDFKREGNVKVSRYCCVMSEHRALTLFACRWIRLMVLPTHTALHD